MPTSTPPQTLILFARTPGLEAHYKTPGSRTLALQLHEGLLRALLHECSTLPEHIRLQLSLDGPERAQKEVAQRFRKSSPGRIVDLAAQREGSFAQRIVAAVDRAYQRGAEQVVVVGNDTPSQRGTHIVQAFSSLQRGAHTVLGPSLDGGAWLLGLRDAATWSSLRRHWLCSVSWQSGNVLSGLQETILGAGCSSVVLTRLRDLDDFRVWSAHSASLRACGLGFLHAAIKHHLQRPETSPVLLFCSLKSLFLSGTCAPRGPPSL